MDNDKSYINLPVPTEIGTNWRRVCDRLGLDYNEDLAGL